MSQAKPKRKKLARYSYGARRVLGILCTYSALRDGMNFEGLAENLLAEELREGGLADFGGARKYYGRYYATEKGREAWAEWSNKVPPRPSPSS